MIGYGKFIFVAGNLRRGATFLRIASSGIAIYNRITALVATKRVFAVHLQRLDGIIDLGVMRFTGLPPSLSDIFHRDYAERR